MERQKEPGDGPPHPLDLVARRAVEQLAATLALIAVERRGALVVRGAWGAGTQELVGRVVQLDAPPSGCARLATGVASVVLSAAAGATGEEVQYVQSDPDNEPRVLVVVRAGMDGPTSKASLDWLRFAAEVVVAAESAGERQRLRSGLQEREDERRRWARELHDETLQELGAIQVLLSSTLHRDSAHREDLDRENNSRDAVDALRLASEILARQITGLRHLITELRPAGLDELGLRAPLQALARRVRAVSGIPVHVVVDLPYADGRAATRLLPDIEEAIYRVIQEAVANACRHAQPTRIRVSVVEGDTDIDVRVSDDGRGLHQGPEPAGFGLVGMRERAELAGGRLEVLDVGPYGQRGRGTTVRLVVPASHRPAEGGPTAEHPQT